MYFYLNGVLKTNSGVNVYFNDTLITLNVVIRSVLNSNNLKLSLESLTKSAENSVPFIFFWLYIKYLTKI